MTTTQEPVAAVIVQRRPLPRGVWIMLIIAALIAGSAGGWVIGNQNSVAPAHRAAVCKQAYVRELAISHKWDGITASVAQTAASVAQVGSSYYEIAMDELTTQQQNITDLYSEQDAVAHLGCK